MFKRLIKITLALFGVAIALVIALPMLLSISKVNQFILSRINDRIPGKLHAQEIRLGWTDGLYVRDLVLHDPQGRNVASFKKISCDISLLSLLHAPAVVGKIEIDSPKISLIDDEKKGHFSIENLLTTANSSFPATLAKNPDLLISDLHLNVDIQPEGKAEVKLTCSVLTHDNQEGTVDVRATAKNVLELENAYKNALNKSFGTAAGEVVLDASINRLPTRACLPFLNLINPMYSGLLIPAIGETLSAKINHSLHGEELVLAVNIASPKLQTAFDLKAEGVRFEVPKEGYIKWQIDPRLFEELKVFLPSEIVATLTQQQPVVFNGTIKPTSGTINAEGKMPFALSFALDSPFIVKSSLWDVPIAIKLQGTAGSPAIQDILDVSSTFEVLAGKDQTILTLEGLVEKPLTDPKSELHATLKGSLANLANRFTNTSLPFEGLLGKSTAIDVDAHYDAKEKSATLSLQSETMTGRFTARLQDTHLFVEPSKFSMQIQPSVLNAFISEAQPIACSPIPFQLEISKAEVPLDDPQMLSLSSLDAMLHVDSFTFQKDASIGQCTVVSTDIKLAKEKNQPLFITTNTKANLEKLVPLYRELAGSELVLNSVVPIVFAKDEITVTDAQLSIHSQTLQAELEKIKATIGPKLSIQAQRPITASCLLKKSVYDQLVPEKMVHLGDDVTVTTVIEPFTLSFTPNAGFIKGQIDVSAITLHTEKDPLGSYKVSLPFVYDSKAKQLDANMALTSDDSSIESHYCLTVQEPSSYSTLPGFKVTSDGSLHDFPVNVVALLANKPELLALLGPKLQANWNVGFDNTLSEQPLSFTLRGEGLKLAADLTFGKELSSKNRSDAVKFEWQITPERLKALQQTLALAQSEKQKKLKLQAPFAVQLTVNTCKLPIATFLQDAQAVNLPQVLDALELDSKLSIEEIALSHEHGSTLAIAPLKGSAKVIGKDRKVVFMLASEKSKNAKAASLFVDGYAHNLWTESGIQLDKARIVLDTKIQNLPLDIVHSVSAKAETADQLVAVLGPKVDANLKGEIKDLQEGTFHGQIESPRLKSEVALLLKKGTLLLEKPLTAEYTLTPEAGEVLLKDVNPLLVTAARSNAPIKLWIDSHDFFIPLKPFSLKEMRIRNIKIEPGVLTCKNGGMLSLLVTLLKVDASSSKEVNLWFTPIYIEVKNGIVTCKRSDALLADAFPIATWGKIDLNSNKVDMTLGLSGQAISRAFDIATIDPEHLVQIPIHGPTQSPKIDTVRATAKITALKMQQNRSNTTALLGGLLEVATSVGEKDEAPPVPTTYPFPWQGKFQEAKKHKHKY